MLSCWLLESLNCYKTIKYKALPCDSSQNPLPWASCPVENKTKVAECAISSETAYFWYRTTLDAAPKIEDPQGLKWWIVILLLLAWVIVFFIVMKGIQSSGKVSDIIMSTATAILWNKISFTQLKAFNNCR